MSNFRVVPFPRPPGHLRKSTQLTGQPPTWPCGSDHTCHQPQPLCLGSLFGRSRAGASGAVSSSDFFLPTPFLFLTLLSHLFLSLILLARAPHPHPLPPCPVLVFSPIRLVVQEPSVGKPTSIQRGHLLTDNPSGPNHRCVTRNFNWDPPGWGMAVFQSHITETGVHSPAGRVLAGLATFSL